MISIIICSRNSELLTNVSESIEQTIGIPFEIIVMKNHDNKYGICEAYNLGASQSQYPILCFTHEDVLFHTLDWGKKVIEIFNSDSEIGLLGVIGSSFQPNAPASWWDTGENAIRQRVYQRYEDRVSEEFIHNPKNQLLADVVTVDGFWFCTRKLVWKKTPFDQKSFPHFHLYDLDFATQVFQNYRVCITFDILIEHFSLGNLDRIWRENVMIYHQKWRKKLPLLADQLSDEEIEERTFTITRNFTTQLIEHRFPKKKILKYALRSMYLNPKDRQNHWFLIWLFEAYFPKLYRMTRHIFRFLKPK